uniref:Uncharacterized protein n=1 Tax=Mustela putorius furo TaxID=9669 RepID=M3YL18_MUSPF
GLGQPRRRRAFAAAGKTLQTLGIRGGVEGEQPEAGAPSALALGEAAQLRALATEAPETPSSKGSDLKLHPPPSSTRVSSVEASASQRTPNLALPALGPDSPASPPSSVAAWRRLLAPLALVVPRPEARWPHRSPGKSVCNPDRRNQHRRRRSKSGETQGVR